MTEWRETTLGELIAIKHGYAFKGEHFATDGEEIVLTPGNFPVGGGLQFREGKERYYTGPYPPEFRLSGGQVLVVMTDLKQDAPILGSPAFVPTHPPVLHNQRLGLVEVKPDAQLDTRFLFYLLLSDTTRSHLRATATGSTVRHTAPERIYQVPVRLPPLREQQLIGRVLQAIDDLIENSRRRVVLLENMARVIYREWFVQFRYAGHENIALVDSALGPIPDGWQLRPFLQIASFVNGFAFKPTHWGKVGRPIIKIKQLKQGVTVDTPRCDEREIAKAYWVEPGDLLFSWSADLNVYRWSHEPGLLNQHLFTVKPLGELSLAFLFHMLDEAMPRFRDRAQGTTMRHIKRAALSEVTTALPPQHLIDLFTSSVEPMAREVISLRQGNHRLASIRDLLIPKLVTGQIDVSELDPDTLLKSAA